MHKEEENRQKGQLIFNIHTSSGMSALGITLQTDQTERTHVRQIAEFRT
jgi:hypothetical protein